jgi:hypothetical protein
MTGKVRIVRTERGTLTDVVGNADVVRPARAWSARRTGCRDAAPVRRSRSRLDRYEFGPDIPVRHGVRGHDAARFPQQQRGTAVDDDPAPEPGPDPFVRRLVPQHAGQPHHLVTDFQTHAGKSYPAPWLGRLHQILDFPQRRHRRTTLALWSADRLSTR